MVAKHDIVLECENLSHRFGLRGVLHEVSLKVIRGEIVAIVGETGCGKSTLLRTILGTQRPTSGKVQITTRAHGTCDRTGPDRDCGIVPQHYCLYPFLTALQNVTLGLMFEQTSLTSRLFRRSWWRKLRAGHMDRAAKLLQELKLEHAMHLYPHELSGGMRQRVAIAQALITEPEILLLDEPFGALDEATREELQRMLLELYMENCKVKDRGQPPPYTIVIVTHELNEAIYVGDRVVALSRYWNWKERFSECPGATILFDQMAPVNYPDEEREFEIFAKQRSDIRAAAFDPKATRNREEFQHFWRDFLSGKGEGILAPTQACDLPNCPLKNTCSFAQRMARLAQNNGSQQTAKRLEISLKHLLKRDEEAIADELRPLRRILDGEPRIGPGQVAGDAQAEAHKIRDTASRECFVNAARDMMDSLQLHSPAMHREVKQHLMPLQSILDGSG
ncbi:MAG: ATP-binding cassette domain-containing protein [Tepidisphaeraceae bacterium]